MPIEQLIAPAEAHLSPHTESRSPWENIHFVRQPDRQRREVIRLRQEQLQAALAHINHLYLSTSKESKAQVFLEMIYELSGQKLKVGEKVSLYIDNEPEPISRSAQEVARHKALQPLRNKQDDEVAASIGADINGYVEMGGLLVPQHKLERLGRPLSVQEFEQVRKTLVDQYCYPENGQVRVVWDVATEMINGTQTSLGDKIEIISEPVDEELLYQYVMQAWESGLILTSNLHFGALECLIENGKIQSVAILPAEMEKQGTTFQEVRTRADSQMLGLITQAVIANKQPIAVQ